MSIDLGSAAWQADRKGVVRTRLSNGLEVALAPTSGGAPLVTTALVYRAGTRDEPEGHAGIAHFLEHMMFKGAERYPAGEIDRRTQALGGSNNAFTSHDATAYFFSFAADRWHQALEIETDRMRALELDPQQVESERRVVLEEIAMYEDEPWDALQQQVHRARFGGHAYAQPVLGNAEALRNTGPEALRAFHAGFYRPDNAVLAVAGDLGDAQAALAVVERSFGSLAAGSVDRAALVTTAPSQGFRRLERHKGEVARLLLAFPIADARAPEMPAIRLLANVLGSGRSSRLNRQLVDEKELAVFAVAELGDFEGPAHLSIALELLPGTEPARVEAAVVELLDELASGRQPVSPSEAERAKQLLQSDWAFAHERVEQQAITLGLELALFESGWHRRQLDAISTLDPAEVTAVAARILDPHAGAVLGWSLPKTS